MLNDKEQIHTKQNIFMLNQTKQIHTKQNIFMLNQTKQTHTKQNKKNYAKKTKPSLS